MFQMSYVTQKDEIFYFQLLKILKTVKSFVEMCICTLQCLSKNQDLTTPRIFAVNLEV